MTTNGKRPRQHYDDKFRASAVMMLEAAGYPDRIGALEQVAKACKCAGSILTEWYNEALNPSLATQQDHQHQMNISGKVYLLKARGHPWFKIGKSRRFTKRFRWLYTNLPFEVDLLHTIDAADIGAVEDHFKRLFRAKRVRGEWYDLSADDVETFKGYRCARPKAARPAAERMAIMIKQLQIGLQK